MDLKEKIMLENEKAKYKTLLGILSDEEFKALALKFYKIAIKM